MLRRELAESAPTSVRGRPIIGRSPAMLATMETVQQAAPVQLVQFGRPLLRWVPPRHDFHDRLHLHRRRVQPRRFQP